MELMMDVGEVNMNRALIVIDVQKSISQGNYQLLIHMEP